MHHDQQIRHQAYRLGASGKLLLDNHSELAFHVRQQALRHKFWQHGIGDADPGILLRQQDKRRDGSHNRRQNLRLLVRQHFDSLSNAKRNRFQDIDQQAAILRPDSRDFGDREHKCGHNSGSDSKSGIPATRLWFKVDCDSIDLQNP